MAWKAGCSLPASSKISRKGLLKTGKKMIDRIWLVLPELGYIRVSTVLTVTAAFLMVLSLRRKPYVAYVVRKREFI
ncbi:hypothetical protein [Candidatus Hecatella orcuttiae]|uniref:hypothetical protein n=1 Tax=Candidatus Hecatella orcuttiae TaxID=1935119 RepID=UPI002867BADE|nr:hypothetical protein [Candidatus Hecatella orcuttiae]